MTDEDLRYLERLDSFGMLVFSDNHITDAGLEHLKGSTHLYWLALNRVPVTDAGIRYLAGLTQLRLLDLDGTQVSDAGLESLKGLTQLSELYLADTKVTDAGVAKLQRCPTARSSAEMPTVGSRQSYGASCRTPPGLSGSVNEVGQLTHHATRPPSSFASTGRLRRPVEAKEGRGAVSRLAFQPHSPTRASRVGSRTTYIPPEQITKE